MYTVERGFKFFKYLRAESIGQMHLFLADISCLGWWSRLWNELIEYEFQLGHLLAW